MKENQYAKEIFILSNKLKRLLDKKHSINGLYVGQARVLVYLFNNKENKIYQATSWDDRFRIYSLFK